MYNVVTLAARRDLVAALNSSTYPPADAKSAWEDANAGGWELRWMYDQHFLSLAPK